MKSLKTFIYLFTLISAPVLADDLSSLANATLPCPAAALNAAANQAKKENPDAYFSSFGPIHLSQKELQSGGNFGYWVGFTDVEGHPLNYRVTIYCQQGGWKNITLIEKQ